MKIYVIPQINEIKKWEKLSIDYNLGFEYNDFYDPKLLDNKEKLNQLIEMYKKLDRKNDTLHGVFFDINFASVDPLIKKISIERAISSLNIARALKCKAVIFHTNYEPWIKSDVYRENWVNQSFEVYDYLLNMFPDINIFVENMFDGDPILLEKLALKLKDKANFGICLDIGHAHISNTTLDVWFERLLPYVKHIHLNDNNKDADSHLALGDGNLDVAYVLQRIGKLDDITVLLEMNNIKDVITSIEVIMRVKL